MRKKLIYLASPYSHPLASVREQRYERVTKMTAYLMQGGRVNVFSPITHSHPVSKFVDRNELIARGQTEHDFWLEQDFAILGSCDELWVYCLHGWKESRGVLQEELYCLGRNIPIRYIGGRS